MRKVIARSLGFVLVMGGLLGVLGGSSASAVYDCIERGGLFACYVVEPGPNVYVVAGKTGGWYAVARSNEGFAHGAHYSTKNFRLTGAYLACDYTGRGKWDVVYVVNSPQPKVVKTQVNC